MILSNNPCQPKSIKYMQISLMFEKLDYCNIIFHTAYQFCFSFCSWCWYNENHIPRYISTRLLTVLWSLFSIVLLNTRLQFINHLLIFAIGSLTVPGFFNTMRKQFTSYEWQSIKYQTTEWKQLEMFYRHWVRFKKKTILRLQLSRKLIPWFSDLG